MGRTAVAANMRNGKLDVTIGESQAFGGIAKGSLGLASANGGVAVTSHMQFVDVDLEAASARYSEFAGSRAAATSRSISKGRDRPCWR